MTRLGFIGTGAITAAFLHGLKASPLADWPVLISPRNADIAQALARSLPGVTVAADNQAVLDGADMVVLAVRPQIAEQVLRPLRFGPDHRLVSLIAGLAIPAIQDWTGVDRVVRAIPLPFAQTRSDAAPVHPPAPWAMALFDALGVALPVQDPAEFDVYVALSALMETYFGIVEATPTGPPPRVCRPARPGRIWQPCSAIWATRCAPAATACPICAPHIPPLAA
ncbi:MAG: NAD(P)-binding domain-containing protein [Pseudomonadota bacterium]